MKGNSVPLAIQPSMNKDKKSSHIKVRQNASPSID